MQQGIRKQVGTRPKLAPMERLWQLQQFVLHLRVPIEREPNVKPIRKTVGRTG